MRLGRRAGAPSTPRRSTRGAARRRPTPVFGGSSARSAQRVGLEADHAVGAADRELVGVACGGLGDEQLPDAGGAERCASGERASFQPLKSPTTLTARAFGAHTANAVPVGPVDRARMRAERVPQPLVAALADQVQVELAERRERTSTRRARQRAPHPGRRPRGDSGAACACAAGRPRTRPPGCSSAGPPARPAGAAHAPTSPSGEARARRARRRPRGRRARGADPGGRLRRGARRPPASCGVRNAGRSGG